MPRGERAEHEIFEARLGRARVAALEAGEDIGGEALQLEADIEGEEVGRRDHHPHADRREQDQHRIFGAIVAGRGRTSSSPRASRPRRRHRSRSWRRRRSCRRRTGRRRRCRRRRERPAGRRRRPRAARMASQVSSGAERSPAQAAASISSNARGAQNLLGEDQEEVAAASVVRLRAPAPGPARRRSAARRPAGAARSIRASSRSTSARIGARKLSG